MRLSELGEEALIQRLIGQGFLAKSGPGLVIGVGDDAAVLAIGDGDYTLVTTDMLTERIDYLQDWITPYELGWKSVAVNISDIAAMAGLPTWTFPSIGLKPDTEVEYVDELYRGMAECARKFGSEIAGGDTNSVKGDDTLSITQMGRVERERLVRRAGAKPGDRILVTGNLGDSRGGLELLLKYGPDARRISACLTSAHLMPMPRIAEARAASDAGLVRAMMDLSDGLGADLPKLCKVSGVGAVVHADRLPISDELRRIAGMLEMDPVQLAASGGEDFELLMAVDPSGVDAVIRSVEDATGTSVTHIGEITEGPIELARPDGSRVPLTRGWEHFT
jgi:thiamine-monophosphate kinase